MPDGGTIIVGLDEQRGFEPVGVVNPAATERAIAAQARAAVTPPVSVAFDTVRLASLPIVVATVAGLPASSRPCRTSGRAYLRQADGDYAMSAQEEQQMLAVRDRPRYDAVAVEGTSVKHLDERLVASFLNAARSASRRLSQADHETVLRAKGVLEPEGTRVTVGGLYALGQYPQQFAPSLSVTAAVVTAPGSADRLVDLAHMDGPIPDLLDASMEWLRRNLHTGIRVRSDGHNVNHPEFPPGALRELVANALVHRDLGPHTQSKRVEIRLRPDRLVISNPGGLWGVSREQLGRPGGKSAVNEHLYDLCRLIDAGTGARVIEGEGGGIGQVQRELATWPADPPIFVDQAVSFTAVLMRPNLVGNATPARRVGDAATRILAVLAAGPLDRKTIGEQCGLTPSQVRYALEKLVDRGRVAMNGGWGARNTTYAVPPQDPG
jgi:ATP-dependent DNA helicase RecG